MPDNPNKPYDMKELILKIVDDGEFFELQPDYAKNIVIGFARMDGRAGRHRRQPAAGARRLPRHQERRSRRARFVRFCDAFNIPIVTFVDVPGFMPGTAQEYGGIIKHGAKLLYAYAECTVPKVTVITRKAYGGAYDVMSSQAPARRRQLRLADGRDRGDGAEGRGRDHLPRGQGRPAEDRRARPRSTGRSSPTRSSPAHRGYIDDVILPHETRKRICRSLAMLRDKKLDNPWRKHGNIPL